MCKKASKIMGFISPYKPFVLPGLILAFGCLVIIMMAEKKDAAVKEPEKKLIGLGNEILYYLWKDSRPVEEPKYNYIQRLWNYFN